jgi:hypothetical protein
MIASGVVVPMIVVLTCFEARIACSAFKHIPEV